MFNISKINKINNIDMEFKIIDGFNNKYAVNKYGIIKNIKTDRILKPQKNKKGYLIVYLSNYNIDKKKYTKQIHRLVGEAFIDNINNLPQINHKDGNKENNYYTNLEWCNNSENQIHAWANGLQHTTKNHLLALEKIHKNNRKFDNDQIIKIRELYNNGFSMSEIGRQYKISTKSIEKIVKYITYKDII